MLGGRAVGAIAAGASNTGTASVTIPGGTASGKYFIIAVCDDLGAVAELWETNNTQFKAITIP